MHRFPHGVVVLAAVVLLTTRVHAHHVEPTKGNTFKANVVTAYQGCASGTVTTDPPGPAQSACPAVRRDPGCGFGSKGTGKLLAKVLVDPDTNLPLDIDVSALLVGLDAGCEGTTLTLISSSQITSDDCVGAPDGCTYAASFAVGSCVVSSGHCEIDSTFNTFAPATLRIEGGKRMALELGTWTFKRGTFTTFLAGIENP